MIYYILLPGDSEKDCIFAQDTHCLGESSFGNFYAGNGLKALMRIVDKKPEVLPKVTVMTDRNQKLTVEEFLKEIESLKLYSN